MILGKTLYKRLLMDTNKSSGKPEGRTLEFREVVGGGGGYATSLPRNWLQQSLGYLWLTHMRWLFSLTQV